MNETQLMALAVMTPNELTAFGALIVLAEQGVITAEADVTKWNEIHDALLDLYNEAFPEGEYSK